MQKSSPKALKLFSMDLFQKPLIRTNTTEVIMTNLSQEEFSASEIKKIYGMRWGIETSFRDLKHTIGLNYYHSKKSDSILQEIYFRMVMYNFSQLVTNSAKIKRPKSKRGRKFAYKINFSQSVQICRKFLRNKIKCRDVIELIEKLFSPYEAEKTTHELTLQDVKYISISV